MNEIATLQEKPQRCALAVEHEIFSEEVRQLLYGKAKNVYTAEGFLRFEMPQSMRCIFAILIKHP